MILRVKRTVEAKRLAVEVAVRYQDEDMPYDAPLRQGEIWCATIDLDEGRIRGWPQGKTLSFYMKVCDQGTYTLYDADGDPIVAIEQDYVPNRLLPGEYGDYLALDIDETGKITNWLKNPTLEDFEGRDEDDD